MSKSSFTNRLINEKSPYLLQHAHNPVDWYPWGEEAFKIAREQDKPIFLSIGYATCHWCHVMEQESFENIEIADLMNRVFINIKVDREELPEIDALYMEFAQSMMTGSAGWPLNVVLTPTLEPFFATTYLPPVSQQGLMGMRDLVTRIEQIWHSGEKERVLEQAGHIVEVFAESIHTAGDKLPDKQRIHLTAELLFKMADPVYGGMKGSPKFPIGYQGDFLLSYSFIFSETRALFLVERTLDMMHRGGIYDHIGGGFSRYSVDEHWLVPHFEKMLYDNAILARTYTLAWQLTKRSLFAQVSREILDYILRDMTHGEGGFYSAEDADSEGREGYFYTWTLQEVGQVLSPEDANLFCAFYDVTPHGNFEERSILHMPQDIPTFASKIGVDPETLQTRLNTLRKDMWQAREKRIHPIKDDKVLSGWNGLMIHAMAESACAYGEKRYLEGAVRAAQFLRQKLWLNGHLLRRWREGDADFTAGLEEYASVIRAAISLFETGCGAEWLQWAVEMAQILKTEFKAEEGAFYQTDGKNPNLILRKVHYSDGAEPSANALHCENLLRLAQITRNSDYSQQAEDIFKAVKRYLDNYPPGYTYHVVNLLRYVDRQAPVLVILLNGKKEFKDDLLALIYQHYIPHRTVIWHHQGEHELLSLLPFLSEMKPMEAQTTLYICKQGVCLPPIHDFAEMSEAIAKL